MSAMEPLCRLIGIDPYKLSKEECIFLEAELLYSICEELKEYFREAAQRLFSFNEFTMENGECNA